MAPRGPLVLLLVTALSAWARAERTPDQIRADYIAVRGELLASQVGVGDNEKKVEGSGLLERAFALIGEWTVGRLRAHPASTAAALVAAVTSLNPGDPGPPCIAESEEDISPFFCELERFLIEAEAMTLDSGDRPAFAVAVSYAYWGRLLVILPTGVATSAPINRNGTLHPLADTRTGARRFYVDARYDWPTSACSSGGELSLWQWDGREARALVKDGYSDMGPGTGWGIHHRGSWLKVYTRGARTFGECCMCSDLKAVWKIRIDPDGVRDLGVHHFVREFDVIDELLYRTLHGREVGDLAAPAVAQRVAEGVAKIERFDPAGDYLATVAHWYRDSSDFDFGLEGSFELVFTFVDRGGTPFAAAARIPDPKTGDFLRAVETRLRDLHLDRNRIADRRRVVELVAREHPELVPRPEDVHRVVEHYCGDVFENGLTRPSGCPRVATFCTPHCTSEGADER